MDWYHAVRPLIFAVDPEVDHHIVADGLKVFNHHTKPLQKMFWVKNRTTLKTTVKGVDFSSPVGIAAGFDKNGQFFNSLGALGAGFVEVGSVTKQAQNGNPKKRIFRLPEDSAIINRMGLNNDGIEEVVKRIKQVDHKTKIGLSIAPSHVLDTSQMVSELVDDVRFASDAADYLALNLSCPNQAGVLSLQEPQILTDLLQEIKALNLSTPIFCKFSSDLLKEELLDTLERTHSLMDGIILAYTSRSRDQLVSKNKIEKGGLSGKPLFEKSLRLTKAVRTKFSDQLPIIFSGGVFTATDVQTAIDAGASLVQVYTGFIYNGPSQLETINRQLSENRLLKFIK